MSYIAYQKLKGDLYNTMTLTEILPSLQKLSYQEKIKAIQFLAIELAKDTQSSVSLENGRTYEVWSPYDYPPSALFWTRGRTDTLV